ncbi:Sugar phosphate transporter domain [Dillenia turbinata]|uniref:Sugar phosphate transporter domain n=1 Tax=Dillenia turbinata TaxID=194707 RepID=A0AAN8VJ18_9MAGN
MLRVDYTSYLASPGYILIFVEYNLQWVLSPKYFNFPFPITLTMIHMGFSGAVAICLIRVFKFLVFLVSSLRLPFLSPKRILFLFLSLCEHAGHCQFDIYVFPVRYATCVIPICAFFASSLWFGNTAYLHISVAFIQMLKALMPVATFVMAVLCGTDKLRCDVFLNMLLVSDGVVISSYGEIHFNVVGTVCQVTGIFAEALRLVMTQVLLQKKGLTLNPITSLYYIAPCRYLPYIILDHIFSPKSSEQAALCLAMQHNDWKLEKKSSDIYEPGNSNDNGGGNGQQSDYNIDEEAPLISSSRLSHIGGTQLSSQSPWLASKM